VAPYLLCSALLAFLISAALTPPCGRLAKRLGMIDTPGGRKTHRDPTPLLGGLAIIVAVSVAQLAVPGAFDRQLIAILVGGAVLAAIGFLDDRLSVSNWWKLLAQLLAAGVALSAGYQFHAFGNWADYALALLWIVGITNAVNFVDNMDGLAAGLVAIVATAIAILSFLTHQWLIGSLSAALAGAAAGFFVYNRSPARIFMGDMGSLPLGYALAIAGIEWANGRADPVAGGMILVVAFGVLIFDLVLVVLTRSIDGRSPFRAAPDHISYQLVASGMHPKRAVTTIHLASVALGIAALAMSQASPAIAVGIFIGVGGVALSALCYFLLRLRGQGRSAAL
jgi:UDP-GlcNAc:undecaprenyl-phosphate GlcNAc-1-phosphate transferase